MSNNNKKADAEVRRSETNEGGVHTVREERTTTVKSGKPAHTSTVLSSAPSASYLIPIVLAVILAVLLLSFRSGGIANKPKTWTDHVGDALSDVKSKISDLTGMGSSDDVAAYAKKHGMDPDKAKAKVHEAAEKAKIKAKEAAAKAKKEGKPYVDSASDTLNDAADSIKSKLSDAYDSAGEYVEDLKDKVGIHNTDEAKAQAAKAAAAAKKKAGEGYDAAK